jgi:hypothetical protein
MLNRFSAEMSCCVAHAMLQLPIMIFFLLFLICFYDFWNRGDPETQEKDMILLYPTA